MRFSVMGSFPVLFLEVLLNILKDFFLFDRNLSNTDTIVFAV
jgi:hypothetical protein